MGTTARAREIGWEIVAGLTTGVFVSVFTISMSVVMFSGAYTEYASFGIQAGFVTSCVSALTMAFHKRLKTAAASLQDVPAIMLAVLGSGIADTLTEAGKVEGIVPTYIALILLTKCLAGFLFILLGKFRLGNVMQFLPFPIVGGFLASIGWFLLKAGIEFNIPQTSANVVLTSDTFYYWLSLLFFVMLFLVLRRYWPDYAFVISIGVAGLLFYGVASIFHFSLSELTQHHWMLSTDTTAKVQYFNWRLLGSVDLGVLQEFILPSLLIVFFSGLSLLLVLSSFTAMTNVECDSNQELQWHGTANLLALPFGGLGVSYRYFTGSWLLHTFATFSFIPNMVIACVCLWMIFMPQILSYVPSFIPGGFMAITGMQILYRWLVEEAKTCSLIDYGISMIVLIAILYAGLIYGLMIGALIALVIFMINYSRSNVIQSIAYSSDLHSATTYKQEIRQLLSRFGEEHLIVQLKGYLFFGNAANIVRVFHSILATHAALKRVTFDFAHVSGVDGTFVYQFIKIHTLCSEKKIRLCLSSLKQEYASLVLGRLGNKACSDIVQFSDLNQALLDYEHDLCFSHHLDYTQPVDIEDIVQHVLPKDHDGLLLTSLLQRMTLPTGFSLFRQNDTGDRCFFVTRGKLSVFFEREQGERSVVDTLTPGAIVGEISLYTHSLRSATVVAERDSELYALSRETLCTLESRHPHVAGQIHRYMAIESMKKILHSNKIIRAMQ